MLSGVEAGKLLHGLSYDEYAALGGLRASHLHHLKKSPAHYQVAKTIGEKETPALRFGKLFHSAVENGERFLSTMRIEPHFTGKTKDGRESAQSGEAKQAKKEWYASLPPGTQVVTQDDADCLTGMFGALYRHKLVGNLMKGGARETSVIVMDPETGIPIQCRPDFISERGFLVDIKTTRDATQRFFESQIFSDYGPQYVIAAAHYAHIARLTGICRHDSVSLVAVEKEPPYGIMIYPLDEGCLDAGEQWRSYLTRKFALCLERNEWPCYTERAVPVVPPQYMSMPPIGE